MNEIVAEILDTEKTMDESELLVQILSKEEKFKHLQISVMY